MKELKFATGNEAIQYLADLVGDQIKVGGSIKGPGVPDGTGPMSDTEQCPIAEDEELKFSNENEALQYLADVTGKSIKVASGQYTLNVTYEVITEESAQQGDFAESDFLEKDIKFDSLSELIDYLLDRGAAEGSSDSYRTVDPERDMETGEETYYGFHVSGLTNEESDIVDKSISQRQNLAEKLDD